MIKDNMVQLNLRFDKRPGQVFRDASYRRLAGPTSWVDKGSATRTAAVFFFVMSSYLFFAAPSGSLKSLVVGPRLTPTPFCRSAAMFCSLFSLAQVASLMNELKSHVPTQMNDSRNLKKLK